MPAPNIVFSGGYADFKLVKTRQVAQVIIEIPLAGAAEFVRLFGLPDPAAEVPLAIARLKDKTVIEHEPAIKKPRKFEDLTPAQQAGISCNEPRFWSYLREEHGYDVTNENDAADAVRHYCEVDSRAQLHPGSHGATKWAFLASHYQGWALGEQVGA